MSGLTCVNTQAFGIITTCTPLKWIDRSSGIALTNHKIQIQLIFVMIVKASPRPIRSLTTMKS